MEPIKMITIDLDGTLLRSDGSVSDHTVETLQKARQKASSLPLLRAACTRRKGLWRTAGLRRQSDAALCRRFD